MELNLILNHTGSKLFTKITGTEGFTNPKNQFQDRTRGSIKNKNKIES